MAGHANEIQRIRRAMTFVSSANLVRTGGDLDSATAGILPGSRAVRSHARYVGPPENLHDVRPGRLLRLVEEQAPTGTPTRQGTR
jgi:hypothetical protein